AGPDQASVHMHSSTSGVFGRRPGGGAGHGFRRAYLIRPRARRRHEQGSGHLPAGVQKRETGRTLARLSASPEGSMSSRYNAAHVRSPSPECPLISRYNAADNEVLSGLDPVKRRPGMYTDTSRPNHLAQEVIDNAVDEALAGHARTVEVTLYRDGSCEVSDDG